jgi:hypothetical protein
MVRNTASKPGDAEHDAAVQRVGVDRILIGVGFPQIDLRQVGCGEFGDKGDDRAGVERDAEYVVLAALDPVEREALARRDAENALRAQIGPEQAGSDEPEMRGDDQPVDLLVGDVGERKHRPVAGMAGANWRAPRSGGRCRRAPAAVETWKASPRRL